MQATPAAHQYSISWKVPPRPCENMDNLEVRLFDTGITIHCHLLTRKFSERRFGQFFSIFFWKRLLKILVFFTFRQYHGIYMLLANKFNNYDMISIYD